MMDLLLTVVLFTLGIVLIVKGGDAFVDAAAWMAEVSGIPKLIVGATVVSFATTLPELLVSSMAAFDGKVDMAIGNAVGSVTANLALIMGIALVCLGLNAVFQCLLGELYDQIFVTVINGCFDFFQNFLHVCCSSCQLL